jgi:hypothetical protein
MIKNKIWLQLDIEREILESSALEQYEDSLDVLKPELDFNQIRKENDRDLKIIFESLILQEATKILEIRNINILNLWHDKVEEKIISFEECCKLFIVSDLIYPFWNLPYDVLYDFYILNRTNDPKLNIDIYIGKIKFLFNLDNGDFELFETWAKFQDIKNN